MRPASPSALRRRRFSAGLEGGGAASVPLGRRFTQTRFLDRRAAVRLQQLRPVVAHFVDLAIDWPDAQPVGGEGLEQDRQVAFLFAEPNFRRRRSDHDRQGIWMRKAGESMSR